MPTTTMPALPPRPAAQARPVRAERASDRAADLLRVAIVPSSLGLVLVAVGADGLRFVQLGDDADALRDELRRREPRAALAEADDAVRALAACVVAAIERGAAAADLPLALDARGTEFQRRVWAALREVPAGTTTTYAALAARVGRPAAVRAVAGACAANPIAVLVPCHRVVRADGALSGYRWGVERKRALLAREGAR